MRTIHTDRVRGEWLGTLVLLAVSLITGGVFWGWAVREADLRLRADSLHKAALIARSIRVSDIQALSGTKKDLNSSVYLRLKQQLAALKETEPKCRFLYLVGQRPEGMIFFFVDAEPAGSKDESPAGQEYPEAARFLRTFGGEAGYIIGPVQDRWGKWMSAVFMLRDLKAGRPVAALCMDFDAGEWRREILRAGSVPLACTALLLVFILTGHVLFKRRHTWMPESILRYGEAVQMASVGLVLTLAVTWVVRQHERQSYEEAFAQVVDSQFANVTDAFRTLGDVELAGLARFIESSEKVAPYEFHHYAEFLAKNPAIQVWEWLPAVPAAEKSQFEASVRRDFGGGFMIWQKDENRGRTPVSDREVYFPILQAEPAVGNEAAIGYDPASDATLRDILEKGAQSGLAAMTPLLPLVQENGVQKGVVVYHPVFFTSQPGRLRGYVAAVLRMDAFLENTLGKDQNRDDPLTGAVMYQCGIGKSPQVMASLGVESRSSRHSLLRFHMEFGWLYAFKFFPQPAFDALQGGISAWMVALVGLLLTGALAALAGLVDNRRRYLERNVDERTALLRHSEENFRRLFQHNPLPMALTTLSDGKHVDVNEAFLSKFGYTRDEVIGKRAADLGLFKESDRRDRLVEQLKQKDQLDSMELKFGRKDGTVLTGLLSGELVRYQDVDCILTVLMDISDRKRDEVERLRLATAIEQAAEAILITNLDGVIQYANPACEVITGYSNAELVGQTPRILNSGKHDAAFYRDMWVTIRGGKIWSGRIINKKKDGSTYTEEGSISPVRDETGAIVNYVAVKRDITNELKLERQFLQAQKMDVVGRLAGGVAHDFNNMLGVILGYTEMALTRVDPSQPLHADLEEVRSSALRTADLTRQLLAFARKQTILPRILDLNASVSSALNMLRRMIGENIKLEWNPKPDLWPVRLDPSQIDQMLSNLCINSRDAIQGNGRITLSTDNVVLDHEYCATHDGAYPGEYVMMMFTDTGVGMTSDVLAHIFEPFYTTKGVGEGTGLGLSTVYGIVKQNHGYISAESKPGCGATFKIYLPRQVGKTLEVDQESAGEMPRGRKETILVVEDDPAVLIMARQMLETLGYRVLAANRAHEAIQMVLDTEGEIHLMIVDVVMPDLNGPELVRQIHHFRPTLKCLYMSSYPDNVVAISGVKDGADFIQKPFSITSLASMLRKVLEHG